MKICILGIDALEHGLIKEWNLENLKQKEYGKVKVPIHEDSGYPHSVQVWASFLTGKEYKKMSFEYSNPLYKLYNKFYLKFNLKIMPKIIRKFVKSKGQNVQRFPKLEEKTFVEEGFKTYNIPFVDLIEPKVLKKISEWEHSEISTTDFKLFLEETYKKDKKRIKKISKKDIIFLDL